MAKRYKRYELKIDLSVVEGSFNSIEDIMTYIKYRLNLRSRDSASIRMDNIILLSEKFEQMEML